MEMNEFRDEYSGGWKKESRLLPSLRSLLASAGGWHALVVIERSEEETKLGKISFEN
jgi:hypothetical protein